MWTRYETLDEKQILPLINSKRKIADSNIAVSVGFGLFLSLGLSRRFRLLEEFNNLEIPFMT